MPYIFQLPPHAKNVRPTIIKTVKTEALLDVSKVPVGSNSVQNGAQTVTCTRIVLERTETTTKGNDENHYRRRPDQRRLRYIACGTPVARLNNQWYHA